MVSVHASEIFGWFYRKGQEKSFNMLLENQGAKHCQRFQIRGGKTLKSFQFSGALTEARRHGEGAAKILNVERWILDLARQLR